MMRWSSRRLVCGGHPETGRRVNVVSSVRWSQHLFSVKSEWPTSRATRRVDHPASIRYPGGSAKDGHELPRVSMTDICHFAQKLIEPQLRLNSGPPLLQVSKVSPFESFNETSSIWAFGAEKPPRVPLLTARHKALRLAWARQHRHWTVDDWKHAAWSDESRFQLNRADVRVRVWRQTHDSMDPTCQHETVQVGKGSVMTLLLANKILSHEYIWDALQRAVQKGSPSLLTRTDLWTVLQNSWWCQLLPAQFQDLRVSGMAMYRNVRQLMCVVAVDDYCSSWFKIKVLRVVDKHIGVRLEVNRQAASYCR
ncbi:HTH_Tnp_Tc3_2 domain-containing protein [Trichonephila clavipes]|nr:HTH_Tnp_Tc3_2 domain-containing protein [Trichonephila clavipes]